MLVFIKHTNKTIMITCNCTKTFGFRKPLQFQEQCVYHSLDLIDTAGLEFGDGKVTSSIDYKWTRKLFFLVSAFHNDCVKPKEGHSQLLLKNVLTYMCRYISETRESKMRMSPYDHDVGAFFKIALVVFKQDVLIVLSILKFINLCLHNLIYLQL